MGLSILQLSLVSLAMGAQLPTPTVSQRFSRPVQVSQAFRRTTLAGRPTSTVRPGISVVQGQPTSPTQSPGGTCAGLSNGVWIRDPYNGKCYSFSSDSTTIPTTIPTTANSTQADEYCKTLGNQANKYAGLAGFGPSSESGIWLMEKITAKGVRVWLGARTNGYTWSWDHSNGILSTDNPLWSPSEPNNNGGMDNCLDTLNLGNRNPQRMYLNAENCSTIEHYVCQIFELLE